MVAIKVGIVVLVIGFGAFYITADNWHPFIPENTGVWGQYGWSGIMRASGIIFFAYIGFDAVSTAAQEAKNPQRDVPIGILASLVICTILYIADVRRADRHARVSEAERRGAGRDRARRRIRSCAG